MPFGGAIKLTGESEYVRALTQINGKLKETSADMKLVSASFSSNDKSVQATAQKTEVLTRKLNEQKEKLSLLKSEYAKMQGTYAEQKSKHEQLVQTYQREEKELQRIAKESGTTSKAYQDQKAKVDALAKDVEKSTRADIANEKAMSNMRAEIKSAEADVVKTTRQIDKLGKETQETAREAKSAGDGFTVFKGIVSNLASSALQAFISGLKETARQLVNITKQAVQSYAEFEQLKGGVETIFGKGAQDVIRNSQRAYLTAGVSMNNYMEMVTGFSMSLLQSLNGDTKKAAQYADRIMIDMSDNAKKMGTDMGMIQNAYQGFAKQNYTMLDNLKLGYGGTKTEAQRLVHEASKMTKIQKELGIVVKDNDLSFGNLANAISVVQKNIGIAGITYEEAMHTIEGSSLMMKASWENLLVGMADETQDVTELVHQFATSTTTYLKNLLPRVAETIKGIASGLKSFVNNELPTAMEDLVPAVLDIVEAAGSAISTATDIQDGLYASMDVVVDEVSKRAPEWGEDIADYIVDGVNSGLKNSPKNAALATTIIAGLISGFRTYGESGEGNAVGIEMQNQVLKWIFPTSDRGATGWKSSIGGAIDSWLDFIGIAMGEEMQKKIKDWKNSLIELFALEGYDIERDGFGFALVDLNAKGFKLRLDQFNKDIVEWVSGTLSTTLNAILNGLGPIGDGIRAAISGFFNSIIENFEEPIRWILEHIYGYGEETVDEFINGLKVGEPKTKEEGEKLSKETEKGLGTGKKGAKKQGSDTSANYASGVSSGKGKAGSAASGVAGAVTSGLGPAAQTAYNVGVDVSNGIAAGILAGKASILEVATSIANDITQKFKDAQKIHSPSKVMEQEVGLPMAQGIAVGFEDGMKELTGQMAETIPTTFGVSASTRSTSRQAREQANMVTAFKQALSDVKIVLNNKVAGQFVETTVSRLIYS